VSLSSNKGIIHTSVLFSHQPNKAVVVPGSCTVKRQQYIQNVCADIGHHCKRLERSSSPNLFWTWWPYKINKIYVLC